MSVPTILGLSAAFCTTISFVPQVVKAWRSRSTRDISLGMFLLMVTGIVLWLIYGMIRIDIPLIAANATTLALAGTILLLKVRFG